ncbi:MAG: hypothetical protein JWQ90_3306 [Hydrocarboniphaga sp.]|uniref:hypothetical protein n=1 Tax=Hydrocarboniphaga sp. TaxID=2033016 RepID=UPI00260D1C4B|nr:hypothetical protein [Hydrocarboniphaga sp.]MDB5970856.1 hypothetical protein [Hydrocarboniphaga sp.]
MKEKTEQHQRKQTEQEHPPVPSIDTQDRVDEASYDSFPASDPPAHNASREKPTAKPS